MTSLTKIKALNPDAIFYGGDEQAGVKLAKQTYDVIPKTVKGGGGGIYGGGFTKAVGFPAAQGWYVALTPPHAIGPEAEQWQRRFTAMWGNPPIDYALTAYDAALVIIDAAKRVAQSGKPIDRHSMRDAIEATRIKTLQGEVAFDGNGDILDHMVSIFEVVQDPGYPVEDGQHQFKYIGAAPQQ